ncbi:MAG TPA: Gfo/Idh/MocA family oxidoreductase [Candidatus Acidoferrales bacterium]|nr:Gfo/Idh/MocA family oxidoreductase [Candidatus Acidoferrales bacterium]
MLSWLVAGVGDISRKRVLPAILAEPNSTLAGIVTRDPAKAEAYGVPGFLTLEEALRQTDAQAVYIATPVFLHAPQSIEALRAGRHVLCEKPMALHYEEAETMLRAADETGRTLAIAYYRRKYPKVERARQLIEAGAIGRPVFAEATAHDWYNPLGTPREWLADPALSGGGPLRDIGSHRIDLMNYLFGRPTRATVYSSNLVHSFAVEDNATALIEYDSGVRGVVDVRWHSRVTRDEFRIRGIRGELDLSPLNGPELVSPRGAESVPPPANLHLPCIADFVYAVTRSVPPACPAAAGLLTEWVMDQPASNGRS